MEIANVAIFSHARKSQAMTDVGFNIQEVRLGTKAKPLLFNGKGTKSNPIIIIEASCRARNQEALLHVGHWIMTYSTWTATRMLSTSRREEKEREREEHLVQP